MEPPLPTDQLTPGEVARLLRVHPGTLCRWRRAGYGPDFMIVGRRSIRYSAEAIKAYVAAMNDGRPGASSAVSEGVA